LVLTLVNVALIYHRRKFPTMERPFKVPFVPVLPMMGIIANLYLLFQILEHWQPVVLAVASLVLGLIFFLIWKAATGGYNAISGEASKVALERISVQPGKFRILVPLANPASVEQLVKLAASIASQREGEIVALKITTVPEQVPPTQAAVNVDRDRPLLEKAHAVAQKYGVSVSSIVRVGHHIDRAILETAEQYKCSLVVMGWKGYSSSARKILGEITDSVVNHARCDIMLIKLGGEAEIKRILLPSAGGMHAKRAEKYVADMAKSAGGTLSVCSVVSPNASVEDIEQAEMRLVETQERINATNGGINADAKIVKSKSIAVGIINESKNYDAIVLGAARESRYSQILFGTIPESVAKHTSQTVILVKHYR
jgi:nucleotide-binding universal stress UspA family protein